MRRKGALASCLDHRRARAIAKEHARSAIVPIECAAHLFSCDHEYTMRTIASDIAVRNIERIDETGASGGDVERRAPCPETLRDGAGLCWNKMVACRGGAHDQINGINRSAGILEGPLTCGNGYVIKRLARTHVTILDSRTGIDPFIRRVEELRELIVGNSPQRQRGPCSKNRETQNVFLVFIHMLTC